MLTPLELLPVQPSDKSANNIKATAVDFIGRSQAQGGGEKRSADRVNRSADRVRRGRIYLEDLIVEVVVLVEPPQPTTVAATPNATTRASIFFIGDS